jgi:peptidoglycan/LPS O-acetylase OafA/YrhL
MVRMGSSDRPPAAATAWYQQDHRAPAFDGLRGIAILLVMLYHLTFYPNARNAADVAVSTFTSMGWSGVDLFFVLSGFLITGILFENKDSDRYFRAFYARRFLRIFPLYYAFLAFMLLVMPALTPQEAGFWKPGADRESIWYWLYLSNVHAALTGHFHHHFLEITWSLAIEEQFYLVWPLVVFLCPRRRLIRICVGAIAFAFLFRCWAVASGQSSTFLWAFTPCRIDTLATGALIALLSREAANVPRMRAFARAAFPVSLLLLACFVTAVRFVPALQWSVAGELSDVQAFIYLQNPVMRTVGLSMLSLLYGTLLVLTLGADARSLLSRFLCWAPLRSIGRYSYALYLFHVFVGDVVRNLFDPVKPGWFLPAQLVYWTLAIGLTYAAALISWNTFEGHLLALKRHFPYRRSRQEPPAVAAGS